MSDSAAPTSTEVGPLPVVPVLRLERLSKSFGTSRERTPVLAGVNLTIWPGEKVSLIGESASGKSTLLSLITGLLRPDEGNIEIDGVSISALDERHMAALRANRIGIALQSDNLIPFLSAQENVELALGFGLQPSRGAGRERAFDLLGRFGVENRSAHLPRHLSGGEAQRVALAVAVANEPALLLADEVVAQLDDKTAEDVLGAVLGTEYAVLFVTHAVELADRADRRLILSDAAVHER